MKRKWKPATDISVMTLKALLLKGYYESHADLLGELVARIEADREVFKARCQWHRAGKCEYPFWGLSNCDPAMCTRAEEEPEPVPISAELKERILKLHAWIKAAVRELQHQAGSCADGKAISCEQCMHEYGPCSLHMVLEAMPEVHQPQEASPLTKGAVK